MTRNERAKKHLDRLTEEERERWTKVNTKFNNENGVKYQGIVKILSKLLGIQYRSLQGIFYGLNAITPDLIQALEEVADEAIEAYKEKREEAKIRQRVYVKQYKETYEKPKPLYKTEKYKRIINSSLPADILSRIMGVDPDTIRMYRRIEYHY